MHVDDGIIQHKNNMTSRYELMQKPAWSQDVKSWELLEIIAIITVRHT